MKHKGNRNEFKEQQDIEIMRAFRRIFTIYGGIITVADIYKLTVFAPASRFFVSDIQAMRAIKMLMQGKTQNMRGKRLEMYSEICRRLDEAKKEQPKKTFSHLVTDILQQEAPEMYISPRQAAAIIDKERKKCYKIRKQKYSRS